MELSIVGCFPVLLFFSFSAVSVLAGVAPAIFFSLGTALLIYTGI